MFIGHYAPAIAAAALPRAPRLGPLFVAAQIVDLAFFSFVLLGVEHMRETPGFTTMNAMDLYAMPYTHSLLGTLAFAAAWAIVARLIGSGWRAATIGGAVVLSHWLLDLLVHAPDLTIAGSGARLGLGLWNHPAIEMPLEIGLVAATLAFYVSRTRSRRRTSGIALGLLVAALLAAQAVNWLTPQPAAVVDPVPASQPITALVAYVVLSALAWWVGLTRVRPEPAVRQP